MASNRPLQGVSCVLSGPVTGVVVQMENSRGHPVVLLDALLCRTFPGDSSHFKSSVLFQVLRQRRIFEDRHDFAGHVLDVPKVNFQSMG